jgi:hypothetical protein
MIEDRQAVLLHLVEPVVGEFVGTEPNGRAEAAQLTIVHSSWISSSACRRPAGRSRQRLNSSAARGAALRERVAERWPQSRRRESAASMHHEWGSVLRNQQSVARFLGKLAHLPSREVGGQRGVVQCRGPTTTRSSHLPPPVEAVELAPQLAHRPAPEDALVLVEGTLARVVDANKLLQLAPRQLEQALGWQAFPQFGGHCPPN